MKKGLFISLIILSVLMCGLFYTIQSSEKVQQQDDFTFNTAFPDYAFASVVAAQFNKKAEDTTSIEELAGLTGELTILNYWEEDTVYDCADLTGIGYLIGLTEFSCYKNYVTAIPAEIKELKNLKVLNLGKAYSLTSLPAEIGELENLETLNLYLTGIEILPKEIGNLKKLKNLYLGASSLKELPEEIGELTDLEYLDIHSTYVTILPDSLCNLVNLKELDLSHLGLKTLPYDIGYLTNLENLNLFNNDLKILPESMEKMKKLKNLNVYDNYNLSESYKNFLPESLWNKKN